MGHPLLFRNLSEVQPLKGQSQCRATTSLFSPRDPPLELEELQNYSLSCYRRHQVDRSVAFPIPGQPVRPDWDRQ